LKLRARVFDTRVAESIIAASKTCIPRNINNSEKARMSRNLGRQVHRAEKDTTHRKLDNDIADTRSLLNASAQTAKDLKAQLKELTEKKKEAGKSPRKSQAASNKFNIPIPKIRGGSTTTVTNAVFKHNPTFPTHDNLSQTVFPSPVQHPSSPVTPVPGLGDHDALAPTMTGVMGLVGTPYIDSEEENHPGLQLPPLDLDLLYMSLENEPVAEPTAEEVVAYHFLKNALG
jgi:hypothetical protein